MRLKTIAANWKMNNDEKETTDLLSELLIHIPSGAQKIILAPSFVHLNTALQATYNSAIEVAAQNMHHKVSGAYTGEVSIKMLKSIGVQNVILGHSERRTLFNETDDVIFEKVKLALEFGIKVIFCFGESLEERESNNHFKTIEKQLSKLLDLSTNDWEKIYLAYEPVWAIGTGKTASPEQAQEMHAYIRKILADKYGEELSEDVSILYGGSVKPNNAKELFSQPDVDGGLIGGASLVVGDFLDIVNAV